MNTELLNEISENLQRGKAKIVKTLVQQALDEGIPASVILNEALLPGMSVVGERFKANEIYVPEVMIAARAMSQGAAVLKPLLASAVMGACAYLAQRLLSGALGNAVSTLAAIVCGVSPETRNRCGQQSNRSSTSPFPVRNPGVISRPPIYRARRNSCGL